MDSLPLLPLEEILVKLNPKSLAMMQCVNRSFKLISRHYDFMSKYLTRVRSNPFHISTFGSNFLLTSTRNYKKPLKRVSQIDHGGSCPVLYNLLFLSGLYADNNRFRTMSHAELMLLPESTESKPEWVKTYRTALEEFDGRITTKRKIIGLMEFIKGSNPEETMYRFEINAELSETTLTCRSSNLNTKTPVCIDGALCWLRNDGSIVAFNHETKQATLITICFPLELSSKMLMATADDKLGLIFARNDLICVYALENIFVDPIWVLVRRIENGVVVLHEEKVSGGKIELDVMKMVHDDKLISPPSMIIRLLDHCEKPPPCAQNLLQRKETQLGKITRAPQRKRASY